MKIANLIAALLGIVLALTAWWVHSRSAAQSVRQPFLPGAAAVAMLHQAAPPTYAFSAALPPAPCSAG